jgi:hypothetical protein
MDLLRRVNLQIAEKPDGFMGKDFFYDKTEQGMVFYTVTAWRNLDSMRRAMSVDAHSEAMALDDFKNLVTSKSWLAKAMPTREQVRQELSESDQTEPTDIST